MCGREYLSFQMFHDIKCEQVPSIGSAMIQHKFCIINYFFSPSNENVNDDSDIPIKAIAFENKRNFLLNFITTLPILPILSIITN